MTLLEAPLFGSPHAHLQPPTRAHFIGDLSPQSNPAHYVTAVHSLHDWYLHHSAMHLGTCSARPPLVINTHGWIKVQWCLAVLTPFVLWTVFGHVVNVTGNSSCQYWHFSSLMCQVIRTLQPEFGIRRCEIERLHCIARPSAYPWKAALNG